MRRSEAIKIISKALKSWNGAYYDESLESYILSELEGRGILPPFNKHLCYLDGDNANQESVKYCRWENE